MIGDDEPFGVLFIVRRGPGDTFSELELRIAATMANVLALYLRKSRLEIEARQENRLAVIGEVVAGLAHCAKNILMGLDFSLANVKSNAESEKADTTLQSINVLETQKQRLSNLGCRHVLQRLKCLSTGGERAPETPDYRTTLDLPIQVSGRTAGAIFLADAKAAGKDGAPSTPKSGRKFY